jgi:O-antigen/teichoic acid export membrane protein
VVYLNLGPEGAIFAALVPLIIRQLLILYYLFKKMNLIPAYGSANLTGKLVTYGLASFVGNLMLTTASRVDVFMVSSILGAAPLGIYSVALTFAELTLMIPAAIGFALFPHLTSESDLDRVRISSEVARLSVCLGLSSSIIVAIFGYPVIFLIFGQPFVSAYQPLLFFLPGLVAMTAVFAYTNYFSSIGKPLYSAGVFGVGIVVNVCLNMIVLPRYGIVGASIVASFSYMVIMVIFVVLISRIANVHWSSLIIPRKDDIALIWNKLNALLVKFGRAQTGTTPHV